MGSRLRLASINTNGIRAAYRKGMGAWLDGRDVDILAIQEVRASTDDIEGLLGPEWNILHDEATAKGRAGVALASRKKAEIHRVDLGAKTFDSAGRWLEADYDVDGTIVTVVSTYVHSGEADSPSKTRNGSSSTRCHDAFRSSRSTTSSPSSWATSTSATPPRHQELEGQRQARRLPASRTRLLRPLLRPRGQKGRGRRRFDRQGPRLGGRRSPGGRRRRGAYTWWSWRGAAFDNDTGWRIDYQMATPALAERVKHYAVDRAESYDKRWSDHTPVVVDYDI
ncbi:hypothetical protein GCM10025867_38570 [Frondihabitans sucicola]|uniref:Endonuclease/exonuclease/phosphatase domain-containing protein n=1 Tax=Frondihabitans sucicola TaxID=1268041 RepID=A0ABM8GT28_9MICO|nr:hypothetical protein GCM10025867_38570 [Frondihabitans sucicola]